MSGVRRESIAHLAIAPAFDQAPEGGPDIDVELIKATLTKQNGSDVFFAQAPVEGDSAILEFSKVTVTGDSTSYDLAIKAYDANDVLVFEGSTEVKVKPGENETAAPELNYAAPDKEVTSIEIVGATGDVQADFTMQWAGARTNDLSCVSRANPGSDTATTQKALGVRGSTAAGQIAGTVRVGWTARDTTVVTVDESGLVKARCSNKATYVVARTFNDEADSVKVTVVAPPFTLKMNPEAMNLPRQDTAQFTAVVVDENGNELPAATVSWHSSDANRASVNSAGRVIGVSNGRVVITASSGGRTTVGLVQVVRPRANTVVIDPPSDVLATGQRRVYSATSFDRNNAVIPDAAGYGWASTNVDVVHVTGSGTVTGVATGSAKVIVSLDGKADTANVEVTTATAGAIRGKVVDGATGQPIAAATVTANNTAASTTQTDANGIFSLGGLTSGNNITVTKTGYVSVTQYSLTIFLGQNVEIGDIPMAPTGAAGTMTGTVVNALNDSPVSGAQVKLFAGINPPGASGAAVTPDASGTAASDGQFGLSGVPAGTYTYAVGAPGFSLTRTVAVSISATTRHTRIALSPQVAGSGLRIVLSWGDCTDVNVPCDLDSHLTGPASAPDTGRFHVAYFNDFYYNDPDTVAILDNDAVNGLGPETITLKQKASGAYKYYVHNFSDGFDTTSTRLAQTSRAKVDVYQGSSLVATFFPPRGGTGTVWAVFQIEGNAIIPVGEMVRIQDLTAVPSDFRIVGGQVSGSAAQDVRRLLNDLRRNSKNRR